MNICPHYEFCGGCTYQGVDYQEQLQRKEQEALGYMKEALVKAKKLDPIAPAPQQYAYRNKMEYSFGDLVKGGPLTLGMHKKGSFLSIVTVDECQLVHPDFNRILQATLQFCIEKGYAKYDKKHHTGMMRNLKLRRGVRTQEILVALVTSSADGFDEEAFKDMLLQLPDLEHTIVGIQRILNDNKADAVKSDECRLLYGRPYYVEQIMGMSFQVGVFSFFQTNVEAAERLYNEAISAIKDYENKTIFDLFCGTGTITQAVAKKAGPHGKVVGIEIVPEAVEMARQGAKDNQLPQCSFLCGDVFEQLDLVEEKPDLIIVDPPRPGIMPKALLKIANYRVPELLYISCNPKTLARDLAMLQQYGYQCDYMKFYDNFSMTSHCEGVCLLSLKEGKDK